MTTVVRPPCDEGVIRCGAFSGPIAPEHIKRWTLVAMVLGSSMILISGSTVNVALPVFQTQLGVSVLEVQWIVNAYTLMLAAFILIGGSVGDRLGRRRVFLAGTSLFAIGSVACGLAPSSLALILFRAVQGIGAALLTPGGLAIISATFPEEERGQAIGLWSGLTALVMALGPVLGGWLLDNVSWRWIFFINLPLAVGVVVISLAYVPESRDDQVTGRLDWGGAALAALGLGLVTYGLIEGSGRGLRSPLVISALLAGAVALVAFVWYERRQSAPMVPLSLFRSRSFSSANGLTLLLYFTLAGALFLLPLNLVLVQGYSVTAAGAAQLPAILLVSLLSRWAGGLVSRVGARLPLTIGPLLAAISYGLMMVPEVGGSYWTTFFPAMVALGLGLGLAVAPLSTTVMGSVPDHLAGTASGINNAVSQVANLLAVAVAGIVMLAIFSSALSQNLAETAIPTQSQQAIVDQRTNLAASQVPESLPSALQAEAREAVDSAFVAGFRVISLLHVALALVAALLGWLTIAPKAENAEVRARPRA